MRDKVTMFAGRHGVIFHVLAFLVIALAALTVHFGLYLINPNTTIAAPFLAAAIGMVLGVWCSETYLEGKELVTFEKIQEWRGQK